MSPPEDRNDARVVFLDEIGYAWQIEMPTLRHSHREVRAVAYRIACQRIGSGAWHPAGEIRYDRTERIS